MTSKSDLQYEVGALKRALREKDDRFGERVADYHQQLELRDAAIIALLKRSRIKTAFVPRSYGAESRRLGAPRVKFTSGHQHDKQQRPVEGHNIDVVEMPTT